MEVVTALAEPNEPIGLLPNPANPPNAALVVVGVDVVAGVVDVANPVPKLVLLLLLNPVELGLPKLVLKVVGVAAAGPPLPNEKPANGLEPPWLPLLPTELVEVVLFNRRLGTAIGRSGCGLLDSKNR